MINTVIEEAFSDFREIIFLELQEELKNTPGHKVEINLALPCNIDEERYHHNIIKAISLNKAGEVVADYCDDVDGEEYTDTLDLFTVDELLEIINAI